MATVTVRNGIDVDRLVQTIDAIGSDPAIGSFTFRARTDWQEGARSVQDTSPVGDILANPVSLRVSLEVA